MNATMPTASAPKPTVTALKPMSRKAIRERLESQRELLANLIVYGHSADRPALMELFNTTTVLWEATQSDEAPEFTPRMAVAA